MNLTDKHILITGASGFIGSFIVERALALGATVWAAVRRTSSRRYLQDARIRFIELDLGNEERLREQLEAHKKSVGAWHYVVHAAGATKCRKANDFFRINTDGTERLARLLLATNTLQGRFVFISSLSVYGAVREKYVSTSGKNGLNYAPILESDTPRPNTAYGRSKLEAEERLTHIPDLNYVVLRPTGVYGPRERDYFLMAKSIALHIDFSVGYKPQELTFIYVHDLVEAVMLALKRGGVGRTYFLTDGGVYSSRTFSDLLQSEMQVRHVLHLKAPLCVLRLICAIAGWGAGLCGRTSTLNMDKFHIMRQRNWQCDIEPARRELGYAPQYPLDRGVAETVAWYKQEKWI